MIRNLYKDRRVVVKISPILFNIYLEEMIRETEMKMKGVKIGGRGERKISCVRFENDMVVLAEDLKDSEI